MVTPVYFGLSHQDRKFPAFKIGCRLSGNVNGKFNSGSWVSSTNYYSLLHFILALNVTEPFYYLRAGYVLTVSDFRFINSSKCFLFYFI